METSEVVQEPPVALVEAVEKTMVERGVGMQAMQATMAQMQGVMMQCRTMMMAIQQDREVNEPATKQQRGKATGQGDKGTDQRAGSEDSADL